MIAYNQHLRSLIFHVAKFLSCLRQASTAWMRSRCSWNWASWTVTDCRWVRFLAVLVRSCNWLVVTGCHLDYFPINIGFLVIPIDEVIFFRGVAQPPTRCKSQRFPKQHFTIQDLLGDAQRLCEVSPEAVATTRNLETYHSQSNPTGMRNVAACTEEYPCLSGLRRAIGIQWSW